MNKIKSMLLSFLILIFLGLGIYMTPKFLNFMETQQDIFNIYPTQSFAINQPIVEIKNINISQNVPIPEDIKLKMEEEQKLKQEEKIRQEQIKLAQEKELAIQKEKKKKEEIKIAKQPAVTSRGSTETRDNSSYIAFTATGYCPCAKCCGKTTGITASGAKAQAGVTVAMPSKYAFGTQIQIQNMGTYTVQDRGGAIQGNKIDIFFSTHQEALNFGRRTVYLKIL